MIPKDLPAFRALMKDGYYSVMDRCGGPDCCGGVCASFDALAAATPEQLLGIIGEGRGVTPSRAEVTDAIAKLKYELGCDPVDHDGAGEAFCVLEASLNAGRKDRERLDWIEAQDRAVEIGPWEWSPVYDTLSLRAAIDKARGA